MLLSDQSENGATATSARPASDIADWLCLVASPAFAIMALLIAINGGADMICSSTGGAFALDGMVTMYLLMSAFHLPPWLRLIFGRDEGAMRDPLGRLARYWRRWNWRRITNR